jgi:predicted dehydrogenase
MTNKPLGVCIIGCGMMGTIHAESWSRLPHAQIRAVVDIRPERAQKLASTCGLDSWYTDYTDALDLPGIDAVSVCIPTNLHAGATLAAIDRGKHVLCEKPMALHLGDAQKMLAAARAKGVKLMLGFMRRHSPVMAAIKEHIAAGKITKPLFYHATDFREIRPKLEMHDTNANGGPVVDMAVHLFDTWSSLFASPAEAVFAQGLRLGMGRPELRSIEHLAWDTASITVRYASGDIGNFQVCWGLPPGVNPSPFPERLLGPSGAVEAVFGRTHQEAQWLRDGSSPVTLASSDDDMYHLQAASFAHAILHDEPVAVGGDQGVAALTVARAAVQSIETNSPVLLAGE